MIYCLIGGKANESQAIKIEEELVRMTRKSLPNLLFVSFASPNENKTIDRFLNQAKNLKANIRTCKRENYLNFEELLDWSDIIYFCGGWCDNLVKFMYDNKLDIIFKKYLSSDKIYAGVSAGAMMVCSSAMGDHDTYYDNYHTHNYKMEDCLGILNITVCPHYQNEDLVVYNDEVRKYNMNSFGIEEDCALIIENNSLRVIKENKARSVYLFKYSNNYQMISLYEGESYEEDCSIRS